MSSLAHVVPKSDTSEVCTSSWQYFLRTWMALGVIQGASRIRRLNKLPHTKHTQYTHYLLFKYDWLSYTQLFAIFHDLCVSW